MGSASVQMKRLKLTSMKQKKAGGFFLIIAWLICGSCSQKVTNPSSPDGDNGGGQSDPVIGKPLAAWQEGYFDIHAINTGRGESSLYVMPDGTTLLVDAAGSLLSPSDPIPPTAPKPNGSVTSGQAILNYVDHFTKTASYDKLNYLLVSHFHPDHMGNVTASLPLAPSGSFRMGGITEVGAKKSFETIIDRGYPDYSYPTNLASTELISNYVNFINWAKTTYGATAAQIDVGKTNQIVMKRNPSKYPNFQIRNIAGNGNVWMGSGDGMRNTLPSASELIAGDANENIFSIALEFYYGKFNYFCGGDMQYNGKTANPWKDIEAPVAEVMHPVDAMKANHHGTANCNGEALVSKLAPKTVLIQPWRDVHPNPETIGRFYAVNSDCNIFSTNMTEPNKTRLATYLSRIKSLQGHIVLRVEPGGGSYSLYVLDDSNQEYKVMKVFGPYTSL